jgi:hypothetical protein
MDYDANGVVIDVNVVINVDINVDKVNIYQVNANKFDVDDNFQNNHCFRIRYEDLKITPKLTQNCP